MIHLSEFHPPSVQFKRYRISYLQVLFRYNTNVGEFPRMDFLFNSKPNGSCNWDYSISLDNSSTSSTIENVQANSGVHCSLQPLTGHGRSRPRSCAYDYRAGVKNRGRTQERVLVKNPCFHLIFLAISLPHGPQKESTQTVF
jgi:hypothetical protein